jgi:hypothetical protein
VYPESKDDEDEESKDTGQTARSEKPWKRPEAMLVFDTETRIDRTQRLTFGSYRFIVAGRCLEEGLFYGDDLPEEDRRVLEQYAKTHTADTVEEGVRKLALLTRRQFVKKLYRDAYKARCLLVAFNMPFDLARIAWDFTDARGRFTGGFAFELWSYFDDAGNEQPDPNRPRIAIKQIDSKRALKGFTGRNPKSLDESDLIPEGSETGEPESGYVFRGHFLDLRTLAFALTDRGHTLKQACKKFGVEHKKQKAAQHGIVTEEYIAYNRRDVLATSELAVKLLEEYDKHPISLQPTKAYSPASIGKAYLRAMGIKPILERQPKFPKEYLGYAQSAFYGGRASAHIRKITVPVVYTDFLSMYPTVNCLMDLWRFVTAKEIKVVEHCQSEIQEFLNDLTDDELFKPVAWKYLTAFVKIIPDGDILPSRGKYSAASNDWQVAINYLYADKDNPDTNALWFSLPDIVASRLLSGRVPKIVDAFRIEPYGTLGGLKSTKLRGVIKIDPITKDFFKVVIEERKRLEGRTNFSKVEKERLDKALKVLANATSYGIYAEMNRLESDKKVWVTCHGIDAEPYRCHVAHPDVPGAYCFPPLAALITGAARLMLALLEHCVTALDGTYAMEDTDSMALIAAEHGGMIPCPGGLQRAKGQDAIKALSWKQIEEIAQRFDDLHPYDRVAVPQSILEIEEDNRDPTTGEQRQICCLAISAKRYALFVKDQNGEPVLLRGPKDEDQKDKPVLPREDPNNKEDRWSEHGLGHLLNPTDPESEDRAWIAQVWQDIIRRAHALPTESVTFEHAPAVGRVTVSSPAVMRPLANLNKGKHYSDQIKPFNFLLTCHVKQLGHPAGTDAERFHLIAPREDNPGRWLKMPWVDQYSEKEYHITTAGHHGTRQTARVKTYGETLREYEFHPESKCAGAEGKPCGKQTIGLLQRLHVQIEQIKYIGKESNSLEEVEVGLIHSPQNVYTEYPDRRRDEWETRILPALKKAPIDRVVELTGRSRRMIIYYRTGQRRPHPKHQQGIAEALRKLAAV